MSIPFESRGTEKRRVAKIIRLTERENEIVKDAAIAAGKTVAQLFRDAVAVELSRRTSKRS
ncbi:MAG: hypothetical protein WAN65_00650 [Candidatus Sulfotelmatobacter sp.]